MPGASSRDSDLLGLGCGLGIEIKQNKTKQNKETTPLGDSNVQPGLKTLDLGRLIA